jgi:penicillin-binding protein 2
MVGMVEQAGVGAFAAGPMLKRIWDAIFGVGQPAVLPGQHAPSHLPRIPSTDGVPR